MDIGSDTWIYPASDKDREPCCMVTEGAWTWFGSILLTLFLLAVFNLKYYRKIVSRPKNLKKEENEKVLKDYLLAHQQGVGCQLPTSPITINDFKQAYQDRQKDLVIFKLEFSAGLAPTEDLETEVGRTPENQVRNRNQDIVPYDYNRIDVDGTYINASLCSGVGSRNYIVTQGPLESTVPEFWKMIWNEKVPVIAMLTRTFDFIKVMCVQYWPAVHKFERYENLLIRTLSETKYANFIERRILLRLDGEENRELVQFQYTDWACYGFPVNETLLDYQRRVSEALENSKSKGPCVVHCNDGGGRSGVYILLDYNIRLLENEEKLDICSKFIKFRRERMGLINTEHQYRLVYTLIHRYITAGLNRKKCSLKNLIQDGEIPDIQIKDEFSLVLSLVPGLGQGDCAGAHREDNRWKNRDYLNVPPDAHRPYISSFQGNSCTDYINAVFVDGFLRSKEFIVTEWPLHHTISDFWSMVYDHEVSTVVVLDKIKPSGRFPGFWPEQGKSTKYGPVFSVESTGLNNENDGFSVFSLDVRRHELSPHRKTQAPCVGENQGRQAPILSSLVAGVAIPPRRCKLFQIETWHSGLLPLLQGVKDWEQENSAHQPVIVVSTDGRSKVGVYTLLSYCRDQIQRENEFNIIQGAATIKSHRPSLLKTVSEFKLVYQLLKQLVKKQLISS